MAMQDAVIRLARRSGKTFDEIRQRPAQGREHAGHFHRRRPRLELIHQGVVGLALEADAVGDLTLERQQLRQVRREFAEV